MDTHTCNECQCVIIKDEEIVGCPHFPKDDLAEYSGKLMSDSISQVKADWMAIQAIEKASQVGKQEELFNARRQVG